MKWHVVQLRPRNFQCYCLPQARALAPPSRTPRLAHVSRPPSYHQYIRTSTPIRREICHRASCLRSVGRMLGNCPFVCTSRFCQLACFVARNQHVTPPSLPSLSASSLHSSAGHPVPGRLWQENARWTDAVQACARKRVSWRHPHALANTGQIPGWILNKTPS